MSPPKFGARALPFTFPLPGVLSCSPDLHFAPRNKSRETQLQIRLRKGDYHFDKMAKVRMVRAARPRKHLCQEPRLTTANEASVIPTLLGESGSAPETPAGDRERGAMRVAQPRMASTRAVAARPVAQPRPWGRG